MQLLPTLKKKWVIASINALVLLILVAFVAYKKLSRFEISPRPTPNQTLLDDKALARNAWLPEVDKRWQQDVMSRHMPIRSLFSDDFSDLQFLKTLLKDKRLVMLGENSHGVAEYSWMKARLIRFLHREMGFDVLAFEGSMTGGYYVDKDIADKTAVENLQNAVFRTWWTEEVKDVFDYLKATHEKGRTLTLAGFDIQNSSTLASTSAASLFKKMLAPLESPLLSQVDQSEKALSEAYSSQSASVQDMNQVASFYQHVVDALVVNRSRLETMFVKEPSLVPLALQEAKSRIKLAEMQRLKTPDPKRSNDVRDAAMADNLSFLLDKMYPNRKFIVWAHNAHIGAGYPWWQAGLRDVKGMGAWIAEKRKSETYSIGLFMGRGGHVGDAQTRQVITFLRAAT
ncbi:MAG: erythromycin esterase family protein [Burkholderiales bacterium]